jgi:hypothetical protein
MLNDGSGWMQLLSGNTVTSTGVMDPLSQSHQDSIDQLSENMSINLYNIQMSYKESCRLLHDETNKALSREINLLSKREAIVPVYDHEIPGDYNKKLVNIMTKFVHKYKDGKFEKVKCRLLLLGNEIAHYYQDNSDESNASTVSLTSLFVILGISAKFGLKRVLIDFTGAFLYATLKDKDKVYAILDRDQAKSYVDAHPEYQDHVLKNGTMIVHVIKALYGHPVSPRAWLEKITSDLLTCGLKNVTSDPCVFVGIRSDVKFYVTLYVDDIFVTFEDDNDLKQLLDMCSVKYGEYTTDYGVNNRFVYLHLNITFDDVLQAVYIDQSDYYQGIIDKHYISSTMNAELPHPMNLSDCEEEVLQDGTAECKNNMLSVVMSLYWASKRSRPDILFNVSYLAIRSKFANAKDIKNLNHLLSYLKQTIDDKMCLRFKGDMIASIFVDSSAQFYRDFRGHGGYVMSIGSGYGGPIEVKSGRSKMNCRSTMEYELVELHQCLPAIMWLRLFLTDIGFTQVLPSVVYEDNKSVLDIMIRGQVSSGVSRYIESKYYYARDLIRRGLIKLMHCPTEYMIADLCTKNLNGVIFKKLKKLLMNVNIVDDYYVTLFNNIDNDTVEYVNNVILNLLIVSL